MFGLFHKETFFVSPCAGTQLPIESAPDPVFAQKMMGEGYCIQPSDGKIYAPFSGTVDVFMNTCHAVGLKADDGREVLIHIGVDSVNLNGRGFKAHISQGQHVRQGQLLVSADLDVLRKEAKSEMVIVLLLSAKKAVLLKSGMPVAAKEEGTVQF
jgi:glucose-specific phosphotransferase system IIA component